MYRDFFFSIYVGCPWFLDVGIRDLLHESLMYGGPTILIRIYYRVVIRAFFLANASERRYHTKVWNLN